MAKFKKGQSGNPAGRPVGTKNLTTKVRQALEAIAEGSDESYQTLLIRRILKKAIVDGNDQMIKLMWNYLDGMPQQAIDLSGNINISTVLERLKDEKRAREIKHGGPRAIGQGLESEQSLQDKGQAQEADRLQEEPSAAGLREEQAHS